MKKKDVCVIGGGLAGLASAVYLARKGMDVILLEKSDRLGGRAATDQREECLFNLGPHALYKKGAGIQVLHELGVVPKGGSPDPNGVLIHKENAYDLPVGPLSLMKCSLLTWGEKKELVRMMFRISKLDVDALCHISLLEWANEQIRDERVRQVFFALCRLSSYANEPEKASAGAIIRQLRMSASGVLYLHGGWQSIVNELRAQAVKAGVAIELRAQVSEISGEFPDMTVTLSDHNTISASHVISAAGPLATYKMVKNAVETKLAIWKETLIPVKAACLDIALKRVPVPAVSFALHLERPLYFSNHSKSATLSKNNEHAVIHVAKYLHSADELPPAQVQQELESFLDRLQPGWRQELLTSRFLPNMTVSHGLVTTERGASLAKDGPAVEEIPGLYVVGDWLAQEGLLADASLSSARTAAMTILQIESKRGVTA